MNRSPLQNLIKLLARLPGIGEKTAGRLALFLWQSPGRYPEDLAQAILTVRQTIKPCPECGAPSETAPCPICADPGRDSAVVMVVEDAQDLAAVEKSGAFRGVYHVLNGVISPLAGRGPESLRLSEILARLQRGVIREVILATNPSVEGDATAAYLEEVIRRETPGVAVSRLARGIPTGAELRYLDPLSLSQAVEGRKSR